MKKYRLIIVLCLFVVGTEFLYGQKFDREGLESTVHKAIGRAYSSSVRMWGFDVVRQVRTGGQFSGVVVSREGHILTAAHVNAPGNTYKVMFPDGSTYIARGLGEIELAGNKAVPDVAMMKIAGDFKGPYAEMGWSSSLKKNEPCISIAYPESLDQPFPTIRFGRIADTNNKFGFIQSTCIMEPGDSGGPLFDYLGRVIGLHSAIDVAETDNFEVPVDLYRKYWTALNKEQTYETYPSSEDPAGEDSLAAKIVTVPGLEKPEVHFAKLASALKGCTLLIQSRLNGVSQRIQGTLVSSEGLPSDLRGKSILISKSSMVGDDPVVELKGKQITATVIKRDRENDLVMLGLSSRIKGGIKLSQFNTNGLQFAQLGKFLISPLADNSFKVSVLGSRDFALPRVASRAYLGVETGLKQGWVTLTAVRPGSPADESKLKPGDQVLSLNGKAIDALADFSTALQKCWPGDKVTIKIMRPDSSGVKDTTLLKELVLAALPLRQFNHPAELFAGGKSLRRDGFSNVFAHDATLHPEECGGPVFDAGGHFYGVNIARFSRTSSVTIPASILLQLIKQYKE